MEMHGWADITILIILLCVLLPYRSTMVPTLVENAVYYACRLISFANNELIGEPMHSASKESNGATHPSYHLRSEVSIALHCQLRMFNPL